MIPTIFGELRLNIAPEKPRRFYVFVDIGYNFYRHNNNIWVEGDEKYVVTGDNGRYTGAGIAYAWEVGDGDMLLYVSLKMIDNSYNVRSVNTISNVETADLLDRGTLVPSFGIRF